MYGIIIIAKGPTSVSLYLTQRVLLCSCTGYTYKLISLWFQNIKGGGGRLQLNYARFTLLHYPSFGMPRHDR